MDTEEKKRKPIAKYGILFDGDIPALDKKLFQATLEYTEIASDPDVSVKYKPFGSFIKAEIFVYDQEKVAGIEAELFMGRAMAPWRNHVSGLQEMKI